METAEKRAAQIPCTQTCAVICSDLDIDMLYLKSRYLTCSNYEYKQNMNDVSRKNKCFFGGVTQYNREVMDNDIFTFFKNETLLCNK